MPIKTIENSPRPLPDYKEMALTIEVYQQILDEVLPVIQSEDLTEKLVSNKSRLRRTDQDGFELFDVELTDMKVAMRITFYYPGKRDSLFFIHYSYDGDVMMGNTGDQNKWLVSDSHSQALVLRAMESPGNWELIPRLGTT